jgi:hypothetical protein
MALRQAGGSNFSGTIFRLNPDGSGHTILRSLDAVDGHMSGLIDRN